MVKVFTTNSDGKIEFTKDELEKLLNEVWEDGRSSCYWWPSSAMLTSDETTAPLYMNKGARITCGTSE